MRHCSWNTWEPVQFISHAAHATGTMRRVKLSWWSDKEVTGCPLNQHPTAASNLSSAMVVINWSVCQSVFSTPKLSLILLQESKTSFLLHAVKFDIFFNIFHYPDGQDFLFNTNNKHKVLSECGLRLFFSLCSFLWIYLR